jgi:hypothetical protein
MMVQRAILQSALFALWTCVVPGCATDPKPAQGTRPRDEPAVAEDPVSTAGHHRREDPPTIAAGVFHACAIEGGRVFCWGKPDAIAWEFEPAERDDATTRLYPLRQVTEVVAGIGTTCARSDEGVTCWGDALGASSPHTIAGTATHTLVGVVGLTLIMRDSAGQLAIWGENHVGQLGVGTVSERRTPESWPRLINQLVTPGRDWISFSAGEVGVCAVSPEHRAWCWGRSTRGRLPSIPESQIATLPVPVEGIPDVASIASGDAMACAVTEQGDTYCWGGRTTIGDTPVVAPERIVLPSGTRSVHASGSAACAVLVDATAYCWGSFRTTAAIRDIDGRPQPVFLGGAWERPVFVAREVAALDVGLGFACYRAATRVFCFGSNTYGQLGVEPSDWIPPPGLAAPMMHAAP